MAQIDQIQVQFVPAEDRLLMRITTKDGAEYLFWMTRRYLKLMWPGLTKMLARDPQISIRASPAARHELLAFAHEQAVGAADFATPYRAAAKTHPLGPQPIVLVRMQLRPVDAKHALLSVGPASGAGLDLTLTQELLHAFASLLGQAVARADWDLGPLVPRPQDTAHAARPTFN